MTYEPPTARETLDHWISAAVLLDGTGSIVFANAAWRRFMQDNGGSDLACGPGANYLRVCLSAEGDDKPIARSVAVGIQEVLAGRRNWYEADYPCHAPGQQRWFRIRVEPYFDEAGSRILVLHSPVAGSYLDSEPYAQYASRLESLLQGLPLAALVIAQDSRVVLFANPRFADLVGVSSGSSVGGRRWEDYCEAVPPAPGETERPQLLRTSSGGDVAVTASAASVQFRGAPALLICFMRRFPGV